MTSSETKLPVQPPIGWVDEPAAEGIVGPAVRISGWALAASRIRAVEIRIDGVARKARFGLPRHDVAAVRPGYPDNPLGGFEFAGDLRECPAPPGIDRRRLSIVAVAQDGSETLLGERTLVEPRVHERWRCAGLRDAPPFFLIPAVSGIAAGGAFEMDTRYSAYASPTTRIGMRVPILYLRTTTGAADDYRFDATFDIARRIDGHPIADDALAHVLAHGAARRLPVLVTLNGGIWSDAAGTAPEWDLTDRLEEDPANCQWNERDEVMPDDQLKHLPGSHAAPELARALTLNVYATAVRRYKKRNLQAAGRHLLAFMRAEPELFVGVNLDPDVYINPFFSEAQWYDYNPGTLRQFRDWLAGAGPYAGTPADGVPDLTVVRREHPLSLREVSDLARRPFASWQAVDPPRAFSRAAAHPFWEDPWVHEWETFRRHLVSLHYDELAQWLVEAGLPRERIWSSQGLMAPAEGCMPLAMKITSPVKNYDSGGVSIEGSKPRDGHLGAIVYGDAATNDIAMENGATLFDTLAAIDAGFAIVEFNTADLRHPERQPTYAAAYRALRDLWNAGARFVSPMAWNGSNGIHADSADYVSFTAWRNTPLEEAARDFLLARSGLPLGAKLWTFGTQVHADDDGWTLADGTRESARGALLLCPGAGNRVTLLSPAGLGMRADEIDALVLGLPDAAHLVQVDIAAQGAAGTAWQPLSTCAADALESVEAGRLLRCAARDSDVRADRLRIAITLDDAPTFALTRIAILRHH
jgi:hypothetical protein